MGIITPVNGNQGAQREFSACPSNRFIEDRGTLCVKIDDARACRCDNGVIFSPDQAQFVTLFDVGAVQILNPVVAASSIQDGEGYRSGGHNWMATPDGALNLDTLEAVFERPDSGDVQPGTGLEFKPDA